MKQGILRLAVAAALGVGGTAAVASDTATQGVDITVAEVNEISVGATVTLTINSATAGSGPSGTAASTYAITTNSAAGKKITAQLDEALASGLTLSVNLTAPSTGSSAGEQLLSTTPANVVTSIEGVAASGLAISYTATATVAVVPDDYSASVIYTIVNDS